MNNLLRYGALPVCVLEGQSPPEKLELLRARFKAVHGCEGGGGGNRTFNKTQQHIAKMLHAMVSLLDCFSASVQLQDASGFHQDDAVQEAGQLVCSKDGINS